MATTTHLPAAEPTTTLDMSEPAMPATVHRLDELLQALTGCSAERAELALSDPIPSGPADPESALTTMAAAMVRLQPRQRRLSPS